MRLKPFTRPLALSLTAVVLIAACSTSPMGRKQLMLVSKDEVAQMGLASYRDMQKKTPATRDAKTNGFVECVARTITNEVGGNWEITTFDSKDVNAFALPGGKIGVYAGLLKATHNQDQLAAVVGHEVGHVLANHSAERMSDQMAANVGTQVAAIATGINADLLGMAGNVFFVLPFSRTHESEADLIGLDLMAKAGFDPRQAIHLWENMARLGGQKPPELLSTHPADDTRIRRISERLAVSMPIYEQARAVGKQPDCGAP